MSAINELNAVLGTPITVVCGDETFTMSLIKEKVREEFQETLHTRAKKYTLGMRTDVDEVTYAKMLSDLRREYLAGEFAIDGKQGSEFIQTVHGIILLLSILMGLPPGRVRELMLDYSEELKSALEVVVSQSTPAKKK